MCIRDRDTPADLPGFLYGGIHMPKIFTTLDKIKPVYDITYKAVSYTHLDVYKRQRNNRSYLRTRAALCFAAAWVFIKEKNC